MSLHTKEHYEIMEMFEKMNKSFLGCPKRFDKEAKGDWQRGIIYQNGEVNNFFLVFRAGYALGKAIVQE